MKAATESDCHLSMEERHQPATVSLACSGAHTVVSDKSVVFNLLLFNEVNNSTELLPYLIARTLSTSIDLIIGLPTIRKHDLVLKIPSHFTNNYETDRFADVNLTNYTPAGINLFGIGNRPPGARNFARLVAHPPSTINRSEVYA